MCLKKTVQVWFPAISNRNKGKGEKEGSEGLATTKTKSTARNNCSFDARIGTGR